MNAATRPWRAFGRRIAVLIAWVACVGSAVCDANAAELRVEGLGPFGSRESTRSLQLLLGDQLAPATIDAPLVEDAALILFHELEQDGYLSAQVTAEIRHADGRLTRHAITADLLEPLPRPLGAAQVTLHVARGTRFLLREIIFHGLTTMEAEAARGFFTGETALVPLASGRVYSPAGVRNSAANLASELQLRGHADAGVTILREDLDRTTGDVRLEVEVREGPVWRVDELVFLERAEPMTPPEFLRERRGDVWSPLWRQDAATAVRRWYFERGFPDVQVEIVPRVTDRAPVRQSVTAEIRVRPGPRQHLGAVRLAGHTHTRERTIRRALQLETGALFNPVELDDAQARLARLGVFRRIDREFTDAAPGVRDALFRVTEGRLQEINLLAGYGSYEQFRAGLEWQHYNLWGRAHTNSVRLVQSIKSTTGDYRYTVPSLFGTTVDGSARLFGLRREELSFLREETGANLSLARAFPSLQANGTATYTLRRLRSTRSALATRRADRPQANVASFDLRLVRDRRDNPLTPRDGDRVFAQVDLASKALGGEVDYQQFQIGGSYHRPLGASRWLHVGLEHALVTTLGADDDRALPVNVRFFPGGDASIRGYRRGEAAPRSASGEFIGAKTYLLANVELEQALTGKLSLVLFADALGSAAQLADYPFEEKLFTLGLGLRFNTVIGPVRVEYGRNLDPRPRDPAGTLLISVGFPF